MSGSAPAMRVAWTAVAVGVSIEPCRCGSECKRVIAEMGNRRARGVNQGLPLDAIAACAYTRRTVGSRGLLQKRSTWALLTNQCSLEVESAAAEPVGAAARMEDGGKAEGGMGGVETAASGGGSTGELPRSRSISLHELPAPVVGGGRE